MYIIFEIQTNADKTVGTLVYTAEDWYEAQAIYHEKLAYAARSAQPCHAISLMNNDGTLIESRAYKHGGEVDPEEA